MNPLKWVYVVLALILVGAGAAGVLTYRHAVTQAAHAADVDKQLAALQTNYETLSREVVKRAEFDSALRQQRAKVNTKLDEVQHEKDSPAADYLNAVVPQRVRDAFREEHPKR